MNELSARVPGMQGFDARAMLLEDAAAPTRTSVFEAFPEVFKSLFLASALEDVHVFNRYFVSQWVNFDF